MTDMVKEFPLMKGAVFKRRVGTVHAVDGVSFDIREGETLAIVGESGCGKTTTLMEVLGLQAPQSGKIVVLGKDTGELSRSQRKEVRQDLQIVFQDPMASLDPRLPIFDILAEPLRANGWKKEDIAPRVEELMGLVGLEPRAGLGAGRVHPGWCHQPAGRAACDDGVELPLCRSRPVCGASHR